MIRKILFLLTVLVSIFATSCKKKESKNIFSVSPQNIVLKSKGDISYLSVYGDKENWKLWIKTQGDNAICSFNPEFTEFEKTGKGESSKIMVYGKPNSTRANKYDTIYLQDLSTNYGITNIRVKLSAIAIELNTQVGDTLFYIPKEEKEFKVKLNTNVDKEEFTLADSDSDLTYSYNRADSTITFNFPENKNDKLRKFDVKMVGSWEEPKDTLTLNLVFIQDGVTNLDSDKEALTAMKERYGLSWDLSKPITEWEGVEVGSIDNSEGIVQRVTALNLSKKSLTGKLPDEVGRLTYLNALRLNNNNFTGEIPSSYYDLIFLQTLWLGDNKLNGNLNENGVSLWKNMINLSIINTDIEGTIPVSLSNLSFLNSLQLSGNKFTGGLPEELGKSKILKTFTVNGNSLTLQIPDSYKKNINWYNWNPDKNIKPQRDGVTLQ